MSFSCYVLTIFFLISPLLWKIKQVEILLYYRSFVTLKVWLVVDCAATASHLSHCGLLSKPSLPWAPWYLVASHPEVCLLSKHHLQEGAVGSSPQALLTEEPIYLGEPPLGQGGLLWAEDRPCHQHQPGANFHSPPGGERLHLKPFLFWLIKVGILKNVFCLNTGKLILKPFR